MISSNIYDEAFLQKRLKDSIIDVWQNPKYAWDCDWKLLRNY